MFVTHNIQSGTDSATQKYSSPIKKIENRDLSIKNNGIPIDLFSSHPGTPPSSLNTTSAKKT